MAPRTPAKSTTRKPASRTASGRTPRGARTAASSVVDDRPDQDEVALAVDLSPDRKSEDGASSGETSQVGREQPATGMVNADGQELKTAELTFRGRTMVVCVPDEVQLAVIQRFSDQYATIAEGQSVEAKVAIRMSNRAISIVQSVLKDDDDKAWVEDGLLRKDFGIMDVLGIVEEALGLLKVANAPNRAERRAAEKKSSLVTD